MAKHRTYSIESSVRSPRNTLLGETLHALAKRHDLSRNLIRIWVAKYEAGAFEDDIRAADLLQEYEANIASGTRGKCYRKVRPACCREIRQPATFEFVLNPHELLGEMLLENDRPQQALEAFEADLRNEPGRFWSLYGAAQAAERAGDRNMLTRLLSVYHIACRVKFCSETHSDFTLLKLQADFLSPVLGHLEFTS